MAFVTKISEKHQSTSLNAFQVKNWQKKFITEEKLVIKSWLGSGDRNGDRITESAKWKTNVFVYVARLPQSNWNWTLPKAIDMNLLYFQFIRNK